MLIQEASYLGVAPWDLLKQPMVWRMWSRMAANAEAEAARQKKDRSNRQSGKVGG